MSEDNLNNNKMAMPTAGRESLELVKTVGTGTFARVSLCHYKSSSKFFALKIISLQDTIRLKQVEHVKNERTILKMIQHPFLITLADSWKDTSFLYLLFPYICGGELFSYLRNAGRFSPSTTLFYSAEIVSALDYLHSLSIAYRDLKPENLLLDREGHIVITDFGFAKEITDRTWTLCGTPEYLAPEIIQSKVPGTKLTNQGHNKAVDWWALGILIYEMLAGYPPFFDDNPFCIYEKILAGKLEWPQHMEQNPKDLIKRLLVHDRTKRLGNMKAGADDIKKHRWFKSVDWEEVYQRELKPPIVPKVSSDGDTRNFDNYPEEDWRKVEPVTERQLAMFSDF